MMMNHWFDLLLSSQNPLLPQLQWMQWFARLGWSWLIALGLALLVTHWVSPTHPLRSRALALCAAVGVACALLPGDLSPVYWLGLAFHAPAPVVVLLGVLAWPAGHAQRGALASVPLSVQRWWWVYGGLGVLLGYLLLLDTLALLPLQVYAWGFSPAALACALVLASVACVALRPLQPGHRWILVLPAALLFFVVTRLPTGNVWDVLLDPMLWIGLQVYGLRAWRRGRQDPS